MAMRAPNKHGVFEEPEVALMVGEQVRDFCTVLVAEWKDGWRWSYSMACGFPNTGACAPSWLPMMSQKPFSSRRLAVAVAIEELAARLAEMERCQVRWSHGSWRRDEHLAVARRARALLKRFSSVADQVTGPRQLSLFGEVA